MKNARILLIEDTDSVREVLTRQLESLGVNVTALPDGDSVKRELDNTSYDLVIADLHLPNCSGFDIARFAHAKNCKIVLLSGDASVTGRNDLLTAQFDQMLTKPVTLQTLQKLLIDHRLIDSDIPLIQNFGTGDEFDETGCINLLSLQEQMGDLDDVALQMLSKFPDMMRPLVKNTITEAELKNNIKCVELAHSLKGAARSAGANHLGMICEAIQREAMMGHVGMNSLEDLKQEFQKVESAIKKLANS